MDKTLFDRLKDHLRKLPTATDAGKSFSVLEALSQEIDLYLTISADVPMVRKLTEAEDMLVRFFRKTAKIYLSVGGEDDDETRQFCDVFLPIYLSIIVEFISEDRKARIEDLESFSKYVEILERCFSTPANPNPDGSVTFTNGMTLMPKSFIFGLFGLENVKTVGFYLP